MARTIPIDPILEKGYNVRLLVEDFDGLIEKWSNRSEKFRETVDSSLDCQMEVERETNWISLGAVNLMHHYSSLFMVAIGKEETSQFTAS